MKRYAWGNLRIYGNNRKDAFRKLVGFLIQCKQSHTAPANSGLLLHLPSHDEQYEYLEGRAAPGA
jgi:hypothetical protein